MRIVTLAISCLLALSGYSQNSNSENINELLFGLFTKNKKEYKAILVQVDADWDDAYIPYLLDAFNISIDPAFHRQVIKLLEEKTGQGHGKDYYAWLKWLWSKDQNVLSDYYNFKADLYKHMDPRFEKYFKDRQDQCLIRVDEILWGGVVQDGIPPLRKPKMISANKAKYLNKNDLVFGFYVNGVAKAYPKRILGWHEFFVDEIGGRMIAGVYCTLCGTVIAYDMQKGDNFFDLGTSGFLYRSNKLMYDKATQSLWSTIEGKPVVGPLVNQGIELDMYPVVTATWGEWKKMHPNTKVLSWETGHNRDYSEGAAYKFYYKTDRLMFPIPKEDTRLKNKSEVFVIRDKRLESPLAISKKYLSDNKFLHLKRNGLNILVLSYARGGIRAYEVPEDMNVKSYNDGVIKDDLSRSWSLTEAALLSEGSDKAVRLDGHNVFWFAWYAMFPHTELID